MSDRHRPPADHDQTSLQPGGRVLVVDDDASIAEVISEALTHLGYEVATAETPSQALDTFDQIRPDVVVTDLKMPEMDGITLITTLKRRDPDLGALLMTGYGSQETVVQAFTQGRINYFLAKPFGVEELTTLVGAALKERMLRLGEQAFRSRLENEIRKATAELKAKNRLIEKKQSETEALNQILKVRQEEVEKTKDYLQNLLESSVDAIVSVDRDLNITYFSRGAEEMFGQASEAMFGRPLAQLFSSGTEAMTLMLEHLQTEPRLKHHEALMLNATCQPIQADISVSRLKGGPDAQGLLLIIKDIAERKRLEEELRQSNLVLENLAITDGLTHLYNHRHFQQRLHKDFQRARRYLTPLSLIMLDLDDFKLVNDNYGHQVGDQVLILLADLIKECVREVDTPARYGGEEFAIILPQTDLDKAAVVGMRLKDALTQSPRLPEIQPGLALTVSLGLAAWPDPGIQAPEELIRYADKALYRAKALGKNRLVLGGSSGEKPLGRGEHLTSVEKKAIIRRVGETLRGTLDLEKVLDYLLREISQALPPEDRPSGWAILLMDQARGLMPVVAMGRDFSEIARQTLENREVQIQGDEHPDGPAAAFPLLVDWPDRGTEVAGVLVLGLIPPDLDFFRDLATQAAMGLINAKLYRELKSSKRNLERKVNELMTLSLMGMAIQRNAREYSNFHTENKMLLARCLVRLGFERALVFDLDAEGHRLFSGVDDSLRGDSAPQLLSLAHLSAASRLHRAAFRNLPHQGRVELIHVGENLSPEERTILNDLGLDRGDVAVGRLTAGEKTNGLVLAWADRVTNELAEALDMFVLHAGMLMEGINLNCYLREKIDRFTMLHRAGLHLAVARSPRDLRQACARTIEDLTTVLGAAEISLYAYLPEENALELLAFASPTATPGRGPRKKIPVETSRVMGQVLKKALDGSRTEPTILGDLADTRKLRLRKRYATRGYMGVPLLAGGVVLGILNVTDKLDPTGFSAADTELAQITAGMLAGTIQTHFLIRELHLRDATAVKALRSLDKVNARAYESARRAGHLAAELGHQLGRSAQADELGRAAWLASLPGQETTRTSLDIASPPCRNPPNERPRPPRRPHPDSPVSGGRDQALPSSVDIIALACHFALHFPKRPTSRKSGLPKFFMEILDHYPPELVAGLLRGLIQGRIRAASEPLSLSPDIWRELARRLMASVVGPTPHPRSTTAELLFKVMEDEGIQLPA